MTIIFVLRFSIYHQIKRKAKRREQAGFDRKANIYACKNTIIRDNGKGLGMNESDSGDNNNHNTVLEKRDYGAR